MAIVLWDHLGWTLREWWTRLREWWTRLLASAPIANLMDWLARLTDGN